MAALFDIGMLQDADRRTADKIGPVEQQTFDNVIPMGRPQFVQQFLLGGIGRPNPSEIGHKALPFLLRQSF